MGRYKVIANVTVDVQADSSDVATDVVYDALRRAEHVNAAPTIDFDEVSEVPYHVPAGAERWAKTARALRFDDKDEGDRRKAVVFDGSWWWTNGHVALRCEGATPSADDWEHIDEARARDAFDVDATRKPTLWGVEVKEIGSWRPMKAYRAFADHEVAIQRQYHDLIADSVPGCTWHISAPRESVHAHDAEGKLVAVVMTLRTENLEPMPACAE